MKKNEFHYSDVRNQQFRGIATLAFLMVASVIAINAVLNSGNFLLRPQAVIYPENSGQGENTFHIPPIQEGQGGPSDTRGGSGSRNVNFQNTNEWNYVHPNIKSETVTVIYDPATGDRIDKADYQGTGIIWPCLEPITEMEQDDHPCELTYELGHGSYTPPSKKDDSENEGEHSKLFSPVEEGTPREKQIVEVRVSDKASVVIDDPKDERKSRVFDSAVLAEKLVSISNNGQHYNNSTTLVASSDKLPVNETKITADINGITTVEVPSKQVDVTTDDASQKKELTKKLFGIKLLTSSEEQESSFKSGYCPLGKSECSSLEAYIGVVEQQEGQVDDNGMIVFKDGSSKSIYTDFSLTASKFLDSAKDLSTSQHTVMTEISGFVPSDYSENKLSVIYLNKDKSAISDAYLCTADQQCVELSECQSKGKSSSSYCYQGQTQGAVCCQQ